MFELNKIYKITLIFKNYGNKKRKKNPEKREKKKKKFNNYRPNSCKFNDGIYYWFQ